MKHTTSILIESSLLQEYSEYYSYGFDINLNEGLLNFKKDKDPKDITDRLVENCNKEYKKMAENVEKGLKGSMLVDGLLKFTNFAISLLQILHVTPLIKSNFKQRAAVIILGMIIKMVIKVIRKMIHKHQKKAYYKLIGIRNKLKSTVDNMDLEDSHAETVKKNMGEINHLIDEYKDMDNDTNIPDGDIPLE